MQSFETTYSESIWMWLVLNSIYLIYSILETIIATNYLKKKKKKEKRRTNLIKTSELITFKWSTRNGMTTLVFYLRQLINWWKKMHFEVFTNSWLIFIPFPPLWLQTWPFAFPPCRVIYSWWPAFFFFTFRLFSSSGDISNKQMWLWEVKNAIKAKQIHVLNIYRQCHSF